MSQSEQRISREQAESAAGDSWAKFRSAFTDHEEVEIIKQLATALLAQDDALKQLGTDYHDGWHLDGCPHVDVVGEPECSVQCKQARAAMLPSSEVTQ